MSKEKILDAAERLFVEKGFDGTSVRALALEAGVNIAMINYYFGSKENLLESLIERKTNYTRMKLEEYNLQESLTPLEKLDHIIDYYVKTLFDNRKFHLMLHRELSLQQRKDLHTRILHLFERNWDEFKHTLTVGQKSKLYKKDIDKDLVIMTVFGLINQCSNAVVMKRLSGSDAPEEEEHIKTRIKKHLKNLLHDHLIAND